jgi:hypothetical protein
MIQVYWELKNIRTHNVQGHPAIAPVITLHESLDKKVTDTQRNFNKLHEQLQKLEKKIKCHYTYVTPHPYWFYCPQD